MPTRPPILGKPSGFAMSEHVWALTFLYFLQGLPYGIQAKFLPIVLRGSGVSLTAIGLYKFLFLPWTLKVLWAPFVDRHGTKKQWLVGSLACLALACWLTMLVELTDVVGLAMVLLCQNLCASVQDISVDALAISLLSSADIGLGNTAQVVGYKVGGLLGGAFFLLLHEATGHRVVFAVLGAIYLASSAAVTLWSLPAMNCNSSAQVEQSSTARSPERISRGDPMVRHFSKPTPSLNPLASIRSALSVGGTRWMLAYVIVYKLGENGVLSLLPMFLVDQHVSQASVGFWTGVIGSAATLVGSVVGGWLLSATWSSAYAISSVLSYVRLGIVFLQALIVVLLEWKWIIGTYWSGALVAIVCVQLFVAGVTTTLTFGWMMSCSQRAPADAQATHYSILASAEVVGKLVCVSLDGLIADSIGYASTFVWFTMLSAVVCALLRRCPAVLGGRDGCKE